jgi:hypothetical protein
VKPSSSSVPMVTSSMFMEARPGYLARENSRRLRYRY